MTDQVPVTETDEFKKAVSEAVAQQLPELTALAVRDAVGSIQAELIARLGTAAPSNGGGVSSTDATDLISRLALEISTLNDQGNQRRRVAPEVMQARGQAHERAVKLLEKVRQEKLKPEYFLVSKVYLNERFIEPFMRPQVGKPPERTQIQWTGMPNEAMRPVNDIAKAIYTEFMASIGSPTQMVQTADRRPIHMTYNGLVVKGDPPARQDAAGAILPFADDLKIQTQDDPNAPEIHVLGTVAAPAKQNNLNVKAA